MPDDIELLAAYFTISGDIYPLGPTEISPFPFRDRVEAAARAGYKGIGLHYADTIHTAAGIGLPEMRRILDGNGIKHVELEFLLDWFADGERRRDSDLMRAEILEAAAVLGLRAVKVGPGFHEPVRPDHAGHHPAGVAELSAHGVAPRLRDDAQRPPARGEAGRRRDRPGRRGRGRLPASARSRRRQDEILISTDH